MKLLHRLLLIVALLLLAIISLSQSSGLVEVEEQDEEDVASDEYEVEQEQYMDQADISQSRSPFDDMFGNVLYSWSKENPEQAEQHYTSELLADKKVVAIYFSASWCGPCRQFTPQLEKFYNEMNKKGKKFEIVFVSRDRNSDEFIGYYSKMPWVAVPLENVNAVIQHLAPKYDLKGIPHLVILDGEDGSLITTEGRTNVLKDSYGLTFPWRSRSLLSLLPKPIRHKISAFIDNAKKSVMNTLKGILDGISPAKVLGFLKSKLIEFFAGSAKQ